MTLHINCLSGISIAWQAHKAFQVEAFDCKEAKGGGRRKKENTGMKSANGKGEMRLEFS